MNEHNEVPEWFADMIIGLATVLQVKAGVPLIRGYWLAMKSMSKDDIELAVSQAMVSTDATYGRIPLPAKLIKYAVGDGDQQAARAWQAVIDAIARHGTASGVDFDDTRINAAIRTMGGWVVLGSTHPDQMDFRRREFQKLYAEMLVKPPHDDLAMPLTGHMVKQIKQVTTGLVPEKPKALKQGSGDEQKVKQMAACIAEGMAS